MDVTRKYPTVNLDKGSTIFQSRKFQKVSSDLNGIYIYILQEKKKISGELLMTCRAFFCAKQYQFVYLFISLDRAASMNLGMKNLNSYQKREV